MGHPLPAVVLPAVFAAGILLGAMALSALTVRASRRHGRRDATDRTAQLFELLQASAHGRLDGPSIVVAAEESGSETFWTAIEAIAGTLRRSERIELARTLAHNAHLAAERRALLEEDDPMRREQAARRLGLLPSRASRPALRRAMVKGPDFVTFAAARALARHRDLASLRWLYAHPAPIAQRPIAALSGLLRTFGPGARSLLIAALEKGIPEMRLECATLDALGLTRCRSARGAIERRLSDARPEVRIAAVRALGRLGMGEAVASLMAALDDEAWPVRAQAARALGRLRAVPAIEALSDRVSDLSWWVRRHAAYALAHIGGEGLDVLCELAARSPDPYAREMAREALDHGGERRRA